MKQIITFVLALASVLSMSCVITATEEPTDGFVLQELSYDEIPNRVSQGDSGFTVSSKFVYSGGRKEGENPMNDSGFQFYNIDLSRWSSNSKSYKGEALGYVDADIDQWYLDWWDASLSNLRANGGGCMIRASYALDGQSKAEPSDFSYVLKHVEQLSSVFAKYPDIVTTVECGMIGAFGEMWGGLYSDNEHKAQVLGAWLTNLPAEISVNVRTVIEYTNYVNNSELFKTKYQEKTVDGVTYPKSVTWNNYHLYTFPGTDFDRIGCYNDAMIQDGNDGGTFFYVNNGSHVEFTTWLAARSDRTNYGGEFSGAKGMYRWLLRTWMPTNAIPEFYSGRLSYYHGGNNAYRVTGQYYGEYTDSTWYDYADAAEERVQWFHEALRDLGSGMTGKAEVEYDTGRVVYPDKTVTGMTYEEALKLAEEFNATVEEGGKQAKAQVKTTYTTGGWSSAVVGEQLLHAINSAVSVTADLDDYTGQTVAKFFEDHLGYRIVLRESYLPASVGMGATLRVKGTVDNTGFANITKDKITELVLSNGADTYVLATDLDANGWKSAQRSTYDISVDLPANMAEGEYRVYLRVANQDAEGNTVDASAIAFANAGDYTYTTPASQYNVGTETFESIYNPEIHGNYIGSVTVQPDPDSFTDIEKDRFYTEAVEWALVNGVMNGTGKSTFSPNGTTNRAMLVTVLYRIEGQPDVSGVANPFDDVMALSYYEDAVLWAYNKGVVTGISATEFKPSNALTREQFATILYRYAKEIKGQDVTVENGSLDAYADAQTVGGYAVDAMIWANANGYITGTSATKLSPKNSTTRAQMATILHRYVNHR